MEGVSLPLAASTASAAVGRLSKIDGYVSEFVTKISGITQHFILRKPGGKIYTSETDTFQH